jgi:hypothetical protein
MSPVNLGVLPSELPITNQRVQVKRGAADGVNLVSNLVAGGTKLTDSNGTPFEISYQPRYPGYWLVRSNMMWCGYSDAGRWDRCDHAIRITPADLDGRTYGHQRCMLLFYGNVVSWRTAAASAMFRLAAGITYTAYLSFEYSSGYYQQYHYGRNFSRIFGVALGEGVV